MSPVIIIMPDLDEDDLDIMGSLGALSRENRVR